MADIFLSYSREDAAIARRFADAFESYGFSVWWDATLRSGEAYDEVTENALKTAQAVVVLWSKASVASRWVRAEATQAHRRSTLVPAMIESCERPVMFELTQTAELSHWQGETADPAWRAFLEDVRRKVRAKEPPLTATGQTRQLRSKRVSIVVLPFANMSGDPEQEYFADGISEDIITDLGKVSALSVISRNSAFMFKGKHIDLPQVARQLQVTHVLEGSVRKAGNRIRITAQLIHGTDNDHLWGERYDRSLADIFELQDEICQAIVAALKVTLFPEEKRAIEDRGTTSLEAYDKYLRAQALWARGTPADSEFASALHREALAIDPHFGRPRAVLALIANVQTVYTPWRREQIVQELGRLVAEGRVTAGDDWSTHLAQAQLSFTTGDFIGTERALADMAAASPPADLAALQSAMFLGCMGRLREAVAATEVARIADPLSLLVSIFLMQLLYGAGRLDDARAEYERTRDVPGPRDPLEHAWLFMLWDAGDAAQRELQIQRYLGRLNTGFSVLQEIFKLLDDPAGARAFLARAFADPAYQSSTQMMFIVWYAALFGDTELAVSAARRCYIELHGAHMIALWFPFMRAVRRTAGFKQFARDLGLYDYWRRSGHWPDLARPLGKDDFEFVD